MIQNTKQNFIDFEITDSKIYAINSRRQLFVAEIDEMSFKSNNQYFNTWKIKSCQNT